MSERKEGRLGGSRNEKKSPYNVKYALCYSTFDNKVFFNSIQYSMGRSKKIQSDSEERKEVRGTSRFKVEERKRVREKK